MVDSADGGGAGAGGGGGGGGGLLAVMQPLVSGSFGGAGSVLVGHPFETVKARMQLGVKPVWPGLARSFAGIAAPLSGQIPFWASFYTGYALGTRLKWDDSQGAQIFAGAVAGAVSSLMLTPADAVKITAQASGSSARAALRSILREGGVPELFRALLPTLARMVPASAVWFATKEECTKLGCSAFVAGGMAGTMEWAAVMPIDTIKTRYTMAPRGTSVRAVIAEISAKHGLRGFYRGMLPTMLRAFPANGAAFACIDLCDTHVFGM